ncbi:hypothetical protein [uncultured Gemmiger sp.]|uniref:hypothetical protein n=1 Tax=uncultured Gemmiger sp. TaxID=1623490 RepID=UPI0025D07151|nr:hypothetical protein [uncultured Gemmiger sp.]
MRTKTDRLPGAKALRLPAVALGLLAGAALCLALPSILCRGEWRAMENTALERPALASEEPDAIARNPLADALYRSRTLYGGQDGQEGELLNAAPEEVRAALSQALDALQAAGVTDETVTRAAADILAGEALTAEARRRPDGTRTYLWEGDGQSVRMVWQPDLELPLEFDVRCDWDETLPDGEAETGLDAWTAFLGQQDAGDWQVLSGPDFACTAYSPGRELCLYIHREEGRAIWQVCSISNPEAGELAEMLMDYRDSMQRWEQTLQEAETQNES